MLFSCTAQRTSTCHYATIHYIMNMSYCKLFCCLVFNSVKLLSFVTQIRKRQVQESNCISLLGWIWLSLVKMEVKTVRPALQCSSFVLFAHCHLGSCKQQWARRGPPRASPMSGMVYHMFLAIMSSYVILPAGRIKQAIHAWGLISLLAPAGWLSLSALVLIWINFSCSL